MAIYVIGYERDGLSYPGQRTAQAKNRQKRGNKNPSEKRAQYPTAGRAILGIRRYASSVDPESVFSSTNSQVVRS
jgi:hypothetical protein